MHAVSACGCARARPLRAFAILHVRCSFCCLREKKGTAQVVVPCARAEEKKDLRSRNVEKKIKCATQRSLLLLILLASWIFFAQSAIIFFPPFFGLILGIAGRVVYAEGAPAQNGPLVKSHGFSRSLPDLKVLSYEIFWRKSILFICRRLFSLITGEERTCLNHPRTNIVSFLL